MRLGVLGPLLVAEGTEDEIAVLAGRQRALLAALLVHANQTVPVDGLIEIIWGAEPPAGAERTVASYMARLRRVVGPAVAARLVTRPPGYLCRVGEDELDVLRFEALCGQAGAARRAGAWPQSLSAAGRALALWRGTPLLDVPSQVLDRKSTRLNSSHLH